MSELILCKGAIAGTPYYIESAELNLYSMEELAFYIEHNLYMLDRELMTEEFITWVEHELLEQDLAARLRQVRRGSDSVYQFYMTILIASGYSGKKELENADKVLKGLENKSPFETRKIRADYYLSKELYTKAITEYRLMLALPECGEEPDVSVGNVLHNLGCAYAGLFLFQEAEQCFFSAAAKNQSEESRRLLSLCREYIANGADLSLEEPDEEYVKALKKAEEKKEHRDEDGFYDVLSELITSYKKEYRKNSQVF